MSLTDQSKVSEVDVLRKAGGTFKVGSPTSVTVLDVDSSNDVSMAKGATVPSDADVGFAKGCIFIKTDGGVATTFYINEGTAASCDFNAMETSASTITGVTAGNGLTGGGTEGAVTLDVGAGTGIAVAANAVGLAAAYTPTHVVKVAGTTAAYAGGGTSNAFVATGLLATDIVSAVIRTSTNTVSIAKAVPTADTLTITFSADPGAATTVDYIAVRAVA